MSDQGNASPPTIVFDGDPNYHNQPHAIAKHMHLLSNFQNPVCRQLSTAGSCVLSSITGVNHKQRTQASLLYISNATYGLPSRHLPTPQHHAYHLSPRSFYKMYHSGCRQASDGQFTLTPLPNYPAESSRSSAPAKQISKTQPSINPKAASQRHPKPTKRKFPDDLHPHRAPAQR
jgi:hypothetical protein